MATSCPKSLISADSLAWIEEFYTWKLAGGIDCRTMSARQADAFAVLDRELATEKRGVNE